ncbi:site-specific DNA-methyltransferase [Dehalobacterium formicoaceticum]|jgi:adenine-specific DNA-methyltransferase|uniref:Site-specific DNA-methyltransferase n=1 Tax=Dehalobacterium formicoaceticum TaxID=51515 RepID=A0ABT1Y8F8_9FIRM|nr:site-specific DNA-methyltransferase [Dehalobacterium formicoaceticum]MCR6547176.1 site-specific DNA-methyltransferase [Dehalobacterium formicoaceticum]
MLEKMKFETPNLTNENKAKIAALFPGVVTDGKVNFDLLRSMLGEDVYGDEVYEFTWVGKRAAIAEAGRPIRKTLRPYREESKDWDTTENLYIEGDNLDVLKLLQESYLGKVKLVYIDPPYNTGNDFVYRDDFSKNREEYDIEAGVYDEEGARLFKNTESNGRFHSDWCSMIYPRLVLARNLLSHDGVMIISISDAEFNNLKTMCDEVFGASNYCGDILWNSTKSVTNTALISVSHTYNLIYFKNINYFVENRDEFRLPDDGSGFENPDNDPRGAWKADPFQVGGWRPNQQYIITNPNTGVEYRPNPGCSWKNDFNNFQKLMEDNRIVFGKTGEGGPQRKRFIWEAQERGKVAKTWWDDVETTTNGTQLLKKIFDGVSLFDNPKPVGLIKKFLQLTTNSESIILDFFSGSATTAHAIMQLNSEDSGKRKFIMVQLPEQTDENSEANKIGFKNICEIGKERIRRAGDKIKNEAGLTVQGLDIGFRVLKLDDTNMNDVYYAAGDYTQDMISMLQSNIKEDRTDMDLLFGCLLDWGLPLSLPHTHDKIEGFTVHTYNEGDLIACFEERISENVVREIAKRQPLRVVFRDSSFTSSPEKINVVEIFKLLAPNTTVRVI